MLRGSTVLARHFLYLFQLTAAKQSLILLKQDKEYFSRQVSELTNKLLYSEERHIQLNAQLDRAKEGREELYDKYVASRSVAFYNLLSVSLSLLVQNTRCWIFSRYLISNWGSRALYTAKGSQNHSPN